MDEQKPDSSTVRGSYSIPHEEQNKLESLLQKFSKITPVLKKSEVIRIGIRIVDELNEKELNEKLAGIDRLTVGRRRRENKENVLIETKGDEIELTNRQWDLIQKLLGSSINLLGKPRKDYRAVLNGLLFIFKNKKQRRKMPSNLPSYTTCWRRLQEWQEKGLWSRICQILIKNVDAVNKEVWTTTLLRTFLIETNKK